jgi:hypothetical protein
MSTITVTPELVDCARAAAAAGHGGKAAVYANTCRALGWLRPDGSPNVQRLLRALAAAQLCPRRARRADAGAHVLPRIEAEEIARWQRENARGKGGMRALVSLQNAVDTLRANGVIRAEAVDPDTGEVRPLSYSAIGAAIRAYGLDAATLAVPAPAMRMRVLHANHVWQIDASLCVLYYLPASGGLQVMDEQTYNDNKPRNIKRIENERVTRYVVVDVASGCIYVEYVYGGESGVNLTGVFINAMQPRRNEFWGVPKRVYCDAGAANTGAVFKALCAALGIDLQWHLPGNSRATGSVEKAQDIVERRFESMLAARPVESLADLNRAAEHWRVKFNSSEKHTRHGLPRLVAWGRHITGHLQAPPSAQACRDVANSKPETRRITPYLTVSYGGQDFDASALPGVYRNQRVQVVKNPWREDSIRIVQDTPQGGTVYHECALKPRDELGYWADSPVLGEEFKSHARTAPELTLARLAEKTAADQDLAKANGFGGKRAKAVPFGGRVDPFKPLDQAPVIELLPQTGAPHPLTPPVVQAVLTVPEAVRAIRARLGDNAPAGLYGQVKAAWPDGHVPLEWADAWHAELPATGTHGQVVPFRRVK